MRSKWYISNDSNGAYSDNKGFMHYECYHYEENSDDVQEAPMSDTFFRKMKMRSRPGGFILYSKLGVDLSTSPLLYPNKKVRIRLRARPKACMISDNPKDSVVIVDCSLYTRRIASKDDYHKKRMDMLAYTPVEYNYMDTLAKTLKISARQNQFTEENIFHAPVWRKAKAMNSNSALTGSFTENPFWYQFDLRQIRILRGGHPNVDYDTSDNCRLCYYNESKAFSKQHTVHPY